MSVSEMMRKRSRPTGGRDAAEQSALPVEIEQRIRERAHALWEREGCPEGRNEEHWAQACREIAMEEQAADRTAGSHEKVAREEEAAKKGSGLKTWVIGTVTLLLMANVVKRRAV